MEGLKNTEVKEYITTRLRVAVCEEPLFSEDSFELLYSITNGHLRELYSIARMCLISSAPKSVRNITKEDVFNAHKEVSIICT